MLIIPNNVTSIGYGAFSSNGLAYVHILDSVTNINGYAFFNNQLTSVDIGDSVTTIGGSAFGNNQLTSINIPDSITIHRKSITLGSYLFCDNPNELIIYGVAGSTVETYAINNSSLFSVEL